MKKLLSLLSAPFWRCLCALPAAYGKTTVVFCSSGSPMP